MLADLERQASRIPQLDGPIPYDDDMLSTPNVSSDSYNLFLVLMSFVMKKLPFLWIE